MKRLALLLANPFLNRAAVLLLMGLNVIHPFIHGTMFDQGALDSLLAQGDLLAFHMLQEGA